MRCKIHLSDYSSSVGVCASCLRERLFVVIEAQNHLKSVSDNPNPNFSHFISSIPQQQPPLVFPRSVSPYISRRKSGPITNSTASTATKPIIQRFYSTPQVGPTKKKSSAGKFGLISKLFRSKSSVVGSSSNSEVGPAEFVRCSNRGMSPQNEWEELEEREREEMTRPSPGRVKPSPARFVNNVASFSFCLSPLVRASPGSRYHWGLEPTLPGEIRVPATGKKSNGGSCNKNNSSSSIKPCLSEAASFCSNRSRKLADFGRFNRNR